MDGRKGNKKEERREGGQMNGILDFSCWILLSRLLHLCIQPAGQPVN